MKKHKSKSERTKEKELERGKYKGKTHRIASSYARAYFSLSLSSHV